MKKTLTTLLLIIGLQAFSQTYNPNPFLYDWTRGAKFSGNVLFPSLANGTDTIFLIINEATGVVDSIGIAELRTIFTSSSLTVPIQDTLLNGGLIVLQDTSNYQVFNQKTGGFVFQRKDSKFYQWNGNNFDLANTFKNPIYVDDSVYFGTRNEPTALKIGKSLTNENLPADNIAIGLYTMDSSSTLSTRNVAVGNYAMQFNGTNTPRENIAIGGFSLHRSPGDRNTAIGYQTLFNATTAEDNVVIGRLAAQNTLTANFNTIIGEEALNDFINGNNNVALGNNAGNSENAAFISGNGNIFLGTKTFKNAASTILKYGNNNTIIGSNYDLNNYSLLENSSATGQADSASNIIILGTNNIATLTKNKTAKIQFWDNTGDPMFAIDSNGYQPLNNAIDANGITLVNGEALVSDGTQMNATKVVVDGDNGIVLEDDLIVGNNSIDLGPTAVAASEYGTTRIISTGSSEINGLSSIQVKENGTYIKYLEFQGQNDLIFIIRDVRFFGNWKDATNTELLAEETLVSNGGTLDARNINKVQHGTTANRPSSPETGQLYFDTTLSPTRLIVYNGSAWVNVDGTALP